MDEPKTDQAQPTPTAEPVATEKKPEDVFLEKYEALCKETGFTFSLSPVWIQNDTGRFELAIQTSVVKK